MPSFAKASTRSRYAEYGFRGAEDLKSKMGYLQQAWKGHVEISAADLDEDTIEITFRLKE
jgi:hypothetical protein